MFIISGHSGCILEMIQVNQECLVKKSTNRPDYIRRLEKQCKKQILFSKTNRLDIFAAPKIHSQIKSEKEYSFCMDFIASSDAITFLLEAPKDKLDFFFESMVALIREELSASQECDVSSSFYDKLQSVEAKLCVHKLYRPKLSLLLKEYREKILPKKIEIPMGKCHGDLTLSNILISHTKQKITLIDFLDVFIESPLQDMVKIRQDTKYLWSSHLYRGKIDAQRYKLVMRYLDQRFVTAFKVFKCYREYYTAFQVMNLLRVLCYCDNEQTYNSMLNSIENVLRKR
jgi:thiamine kinase-like enzyme